MTCLAFYTFFFLESRRISTGTTCPHQLREVIIWALSKVWRNFHAEIPVGLFLRYLRTFFRVRTRSPTKMIICCPEICVDIPREMYRTACFLPKSTYWFFQRERNKAPNIENISSLTWYMHIFLRVARGLQSPSVEVCICYELFWTKCQILFMRWAYQATFETWT